MSECQCSSNECDECNQLSTEAIDLLEQYDALSARLSGASNRDIRSALEFLKKLQSTSGQRDWEW